MMMRDVVEFHLDLFVVTTNHFPRVEHQISTRQLFLAGDVTCKNSSIFRFIIVSIKNNKEKRLDICAVFFLLFTSMSIIEFVIIEHEDLLPFNRR